MFLFNKLNKEIKTFNFYGEIPQLGLFDPFNITNSLPEKEIKFWRECELQNGRLSLFSNLLPFFINLNNNDYNIIINFYLFYLICFEFYRTDKLFNKNYLNFFSQPGYYNYYIPLNIKICNLEIFIIRFSMIYYFFSKY